MTIDVIYWLPMTLLSIAIISAILRRQVNLWIGLMGVGMGAVITYYSSAYTQYAIIPIKNWLFYGTDFTWLTGVALAHVLSLTFMSLVAVFNLWSTDGYTLWLQALPQIKSGAGFRETMTSLRNNNDGIVITGSILALAVGALIVGGAVVSWGVYRFFQSPDVTYNITNPPESAYPHIFSAGGVGLNINLIIIAISAIVVIAILYRLSQGD